MTEKLNPYRASAREAHILRAAAAKALFPIRRQHDTPDHRALTKFMLDMDDWNGSLSRAERLQAPPPELPLEPRILRDWMRETAGMGSAKVDASAAAAGVSLDDLPTF